MKNDAPTPSQEPKYDPIKMLRDYLDDNPATPGFFKNFLINRLGDQIVWYDKSSKAFKNQWQRRRTVVIVLSATIPFLVGLIGQFKEDYPWTDFLLKLAVGIAGVVVAILEGLNALFKSQELYVDYRVTAEQLRKEFSFFLGQSGDYADGGTTAYATLVAKVEAIMSSENNKWAELARQNERGAMTTDVEKMVNDYLKSHGYTIAEKNNNDNPVPPAVEPPAQG